MADWQKILQRGRVQDRRSAAGAIGGLGIGGIVLLMGVQYLLGGNPLDILLQTAPAVVEQQNTAQYQGEDEYETFASAVLGSNNAVWEEQFQLVNAQYSEPTLVLFRGTTQSGCGYASSQMGPHYCSQDGTIYLDETFFDELTRRFGAEGGDVAEAYVIAHEVGHHVQALRGTLQQVQRARGTAEYQQAAINLELQADCYAGVWASSLQGRDILQPGEIQEAMDAAATVGDDHIQETTTGQVNPETWTHGSSEQRVSWFTRGFESGEITACETFANE